MFVIESIQRLDNRVANPAYIVALFAGIGIVLTGPFGFGLAWIQAAIALYVVVAVVGIVGYAPALGRQLALAHRTRGQWHLAAARRAQLLGLLLLVVVLLIVALMVFKPGLWSA